MVNSKNLKCSSVCPSGENLKMLVVELYKGLSRTEWSMYSRITLLSKDTSSKMHKGLFSSKNVQLGVFIVYSLSCHNLAPDKKTTDTGIHQDTGVAN